MLTSHQSNHYSSSSLAQHDGDEIYGQIYKQDYLPMNVSSRRESSIYIVNLKLYTVL